MEAGFGRVGVIDAVIDTVIDAAIDAVIDAHIEAPYIFVSMTHRQ